ncbi:MAG: ABC transporter ATP-binding protein [Infirmifilum sp.]
MVSGVGIKIQNVSKTYRDRGVTTALRNISIDISPGELFSILGPSGCGKTTLLRIVAGLLRPDSGRVYFGDNDVTDKPAYERPVGMVFQDLALFPHLTVYRNVSFSLEIAGWPREKAERRVREVLELVRLPYEIYAQRRITQLSGGQQQRVALARALAREPSVLLLDEPFSHLDYKIRIELIRELKRLQRETGVTMIYVTHDQNEAMMLSDRLALMYDGILQQVGTPEEVYKKPANTFVASFLGEANIISVEARSGIIDLKGARIDLSIISPELKGFNGQVLLFVRPENVKLSGGSKNHIELEGVVIEKTFLGPLTKVVLDGWGDVRLEALASTRESADLAVGSRVRIYLEPSSIKVFTR